MTDHTPGFPPELETAITAALAEHGPTGLAGGSGYSFDAKTHMCRCDRRWISESEYAVHLASVVMEVIAQHAPLEFSVSIDGVVPALQGRHATMDSALAYVQSNNEACNGELRHAVVARPTFPWQEVKA